MSMTVLWTLNPCTYVPSKRITSAETFTSLLSILLSYDFWQCPTTEARIPLPKLLVLILH